MSLERHLLSINLNLNLIHFHSTRWRQLDIENFPLFWQRHLLSNGRIMILVQFIHTRLRQFEVETFSIFHVRNFLWKFHSHEFLWLFSELNILSMLTPSVEEFMILVQFAYTRCVKSTQFYYPELIYLLFSVHLYR